MSADYTVHGDVAVISLNNPPVNGLGLSTRQAIVATGWRRPMPMLRSRPSSSRGAGKAFSGGCRHQGVRFSPKALQEPNLLSVITRS
jgi:3-hydroxyacyl-CoA dehydrogenase